MFVFSELLNSFSTDAPLSMHLCLLSIYDIPELFLKFFLLFQEVEAQTAEAIKTFPVLVLLVSSPFHLDCRCYIGLDFPPQWQPLPQTMSAIGFCASHHFCVPFPFVVFIPTVTDTLDFSSPENSICYMAFSQFCCKCGDSLSRWDQEFLEFCCFCVWADISGMKKIAKECSWLITFAP